MTYEVDLNCDMGESFGAYTLGADEEMLAHVTSANIACGFHAGDPGTMRRTIELALQHKVCIGAHPGLPDLIGFGRRAMDITPVDAQDIVTYQIGALDAFVVSAGARLHHVKPHGALYNMASHDPQLATAIAEAIRRYNPNLILYALSGSAFIRIAQQLGLQTRSEVFADRTYCRDATLTPRRAHNALITDADAAARRVADMITRGVVASTDGVDVPILAETVCIHGDTVDAPALARQLRTRLAANNIIVRAAANS